MTETDHAPVRPRETADYIAAMAHELATIAAGSDMDVLRYLLEMARDEARAISVAERNIGEGS